LNLLMKGLEEKRIFYTMDETKEFKIAVYPYSKI